MTADDIMKFEYELDRMIDIDREQGIDWEINALCQIVAEMQRENSVDFDTSI
jgi:hypothetical protein